MTMKLHQEKVWAGTEASLQAALDAEESIGKLLAAGQFSQPQEPEETPRLLQVQDGVAVISIRGALNNESGWWNEYMGMTGYPEIRDALINAAQDPDVYQILLDIDSGGGAVSGVEDTGKLIRMVHDKVKPVTAYSGGSMASAAYWLGSSAGQVFVDKTTIAGSIGVISTHMERSKMLADAGIGVTVVRSGKYKALANSVEPLSAEGRKQIQAIVDATDGVFVAHVADMRGKSVEFTRDVMGQGREFVGQAGVDAGLADGLKSFDAVMSDLSAKSIDASKKLMDNRGKPGLPLRGEGTTSLSGETGMAQKQALTAQAIAALAAGAPNAAVETPEQMAAAAEAQARAEAQAAAQAEADAQAALQAAQAPKEPDTSAATVQLLNSQLAAKDAQLLEAGIKLAKLDEQVQEAKATAGPLLEIAIKSLNNMQVALGGSALDMKGLGAVQIVAEHTRLTEQFESKFKVGGVAAVSQAAEPKGAGGMDALTAARIAATRAAPAK